MLKIHELTKPESCLSKAKMDEPVFVLRGRDAATAATIQCWIHLRIVHGMNEEDDAQILEARAFAKQCMQYAEQAGR